MNYQNEIEKVTALRDEAQRKLDALLSEADEAGELGYAAEADPTVSEAAMNAAIDVANRLGDHARDMEMVVKALGETIWALKTAADADIEVAKAKAVKPA